MESKKTTASNGKPFDEEFWSMMYGLCIDGIYNSKEHLKYCNAIFNLMRIKPKSIGDFGFGKATLLKEAIKTFKPDRIIAIEPTEKLVADLLKKKWIIYWNIEILQETIQSFDISNIVNNPLTFGIFTSTMQYIQDNEVEMVFEKLSKITRYLYFTVPTINDYIRMEKQLNFVDEYAYRRSKEFYLEKLKSYFTIVSFNLLESKSFKNSHFPEELYRF